MKNLFSFLLIVVFTLTFSGCEQKGCTDKNAINYNSAADVDDGTCIVCTQTKEQISDRSVDLYDTYWGSIYYNQIVAEAILLQYRTINSSEFCGSPTCQLFYCIRNKTTKRMSFTYYIQMNSPFFFNVTNSISIPANSVSDTLEVTNLSGSECQPVSTGTPIFSVSGSIYYQ